MEDKNVPVVEVKDLVVHYETYDGVVEAVNGSTITISEMNASGGPYNVSYRTLYNASQFWYVH